jgi:hypothetical protein
MKDKTQPILHIHIWIKARATVGKRLVQYNEDLHFPSWLAGYGNGLVTGK